MRQFSLIARSCAVACALVVAALLPAAASAQVQPYGTNDYSGFRNILPPGTNGFVDLQQLIQYEASGGKIRPPHNDDQLAMYSNLTTAAPNIQESQIGDYYKDATFGVRAGDVQSTESPEPGVTIVRDKQFGVPHIYGDTRAELMFGIGYATAEDRLFFIDALRHAGEGDLASFAGGGVEVLPYALKIIGTPRNQALAAAVSELRTWVATGAHRINREHPGATGEYDQGPAVQIMDAWWPLLVKAEFQPVLGASLLGQIENDFPINDEPGHGTSGSHLGSSFDVGFYGIVQKDLRAVLGKRVRGPLNRIYCGRGPLKACRAALESSLAQAIAETPQQVYPADGVCKAGDQMCSDSIQFRAVGAISQPLIEWVNRPTFQQADEILGHGPR
jgi:Penicillin amidase